LNLNLWRLHNQKIPHKLLLWWTFEHWNMYKAKKHLFQIKLLAFFVYKCTMRLFLNLQLLSTFFFKNFVIHICIKCEAFSNLYKILTLKS
jgi:hypothetical protein